MSGRHFYLRDNNNFNTTADIDDAELLYADDDDIDQANKTEEDLDYLQDVPYSSSSIDRSSIGSIPWADDAIKKNKLDWEHVERMLCDEAKLDGAEPELRHEIEDWQSKFPQLMIKQTLKQQDFDSSRNTNLDESNQTMSNLSLNSLDDDDNNDDDEDGFLTPTPERPQHKYQNEQITIKQATTQKCYRSANDLADHINRDLHITSVNLLQRNHASAIQNVTSHTILESNSTKISYSNRLRMPPIFNVLETNRRFRGLLNNRSFVQLTQVEKQQPQQPAYQPQQKKLKAHAHVKSAALSTHTSANELHQLHCVQGNRSAWHMPILASTFSRRFFNNKNSIVLPALNHHGTQQQSTPHTTPTASLSNSNRSSAHQYANSSSLSSGIGQSAHRQFIIGTTATSATNSSTTPSTGRSISAAMHHPRADYITNSFFIPFSASKFKSFKLPQ